MDSIINKLENILLDESGFFMKIRFLEGCDEEKLNDVLMVLKEIKLFYSKSENIPKYLALLLIDLEPVLWGAVDSYPEPKKQAIFVAINKLSAAMTDCFV